MVKPADAGQRDDFAAVGTLHRPPGWRVAVQSHVRPVVVVEADIVANEPEQVALAKYEVTWSSSSRRIVPTNLSAKPFCQGARGVIRNCSNPLADEPLVEHGAEDPVAIADDALGDDVRRHRLDHLLRRPRGVCMRGALTCRTRRRSSESTKKT